MSIEENEYYDLYGKTVYIKSIIPWSDEYQVNFLHSDNSPDEYTGTTKDIREDFLPTSKKFEIKKKDNIVNKTKTPKRKDIFYNIVYYIGSKKIETVRWNLPERMAYALKNQYSKLDKYRIGKLKLEEI